MGILVYWDSQIEGVVYKFESRWTWQDFYDAEQAARDLFALHGAHHHVRLCDVSALSELPFNPLMYLRHMHDRRDHQAVIMAVIGASSYIRSAMLVFSHIGFHFGGQMEFVDNYNEARALILKYTQQKML